MLPICQFFPTCSTDSMQPIKIQESYFIDIDKLTRLVDTVTEKEGGIN